MNEVDLLEPGGRIPRQRVVAAARWDSAPIRRAVRKARAEGRLIDLTFGHACHWVYFLDTGHVALGAKGLDDENPT
jgi:regulator of extracellular matrix RemA (YlzA/DUF370 family)